MDIKKLDVKELKALAYDELLRLEQAKNNLAILNQEINSRKVDNGKTDGNEVSKNS